jgi:uncharacterized repeat protein (TIGR02543 family)
VEAVPDPGWTFTGWSGGLTGTENPDTVVVASDTTITANFTQTHFVLTRNVLGSGTINAVPDSIVYAPGDTVIVTAVPDTGWTFEGWSDGLAGSENPDTLVMGSDTTVTATFAQITYSVTVNTVGNGQVTRAPDQPSYAPGDTVVVTAVPDSAWSFKDWTGDLVSTENPDTVIVDSSMTITATFDPIPTAITSTGVPAFVSVMQNYPNPFARSTVIRYGLPAAAPAVLEVYDVRGRLVARNDLPGRSPGWHEFRFDSFDARGRRLPAGVYFYRLKAAGTMVTKKMVITR